MIFFRFGFVPAIRNPLLLELAAGDLECVDQPGERDAGCPLDVVIVAGGLVAIAGK